MSVSAEDTVYAVEQQAERMALGYALLTGGHELDEAARQSVELRLLQGGINLIVESRKHPEDYVPTAVESSGWRFAAAVLGNVTKRQSGVLEGEADHHGYTLLRALVFAERPVPKLVEERLQKG